MNTFFEKNKVFLLGLLASIGVALNSFIGKPEIEWKPLAFAIFTAILSYMANNLRGQWVTIAGVVATLFSTYMTMEQTGTVSWQQLAMQAVVALIAVVAPPPKVSGYEKSSTIQEAKVEGEQIQKTIENTSPKQL